MSRCSASFRTTCLCTWDSAGTSMTKGPSMRVWQLKRRPTSSGVLRSEYLSSVCEIGDKCEGEDSIPCFAKEPLVHRIWQRPHKPRPPHTESMSTPS